MKSMETKKAYKLRKTLIKTTKNNTLMIGILLIAMIVIAAVSSPYFLTKHNLQAVLRNISFIGMIAVAQSILLIVGQLDLSVGKIASMTGILGGLMMTQAGVNPYLAFYLALLLGFILGIINGFIITRLRLNAMVVTIGMQGVYGGINLVITKGVTITDIPEDIYFLGKGTILDIPVPFLIAIVVTICITLFMFKTRTGRYVYAIGNSREASQILGIRVNKINTLLYAIVGSVSALAGMLYVARLGTAQASIGDSWPMNSIAASVIGGVALTGGVGNPVGALLGAGIITIIENIIVLLGVNMYWQTAVSGFVVIAAISISSISSIMSEKNRIKHEAQQNSSEVL